MKKDFFGRPRFVEKEESVDVPQQADIPPAEPVAEEKSVETPVEEKPAKARSRGGKTRTAANKKKEDELKDDDF